MKFNKLLLGLLGLSFILLLAINVNADLGSYNEGSCVELKTALNSSYVNISSLAYPNSTIAVRNIAMTKNGYTFNYTFCNTYITGNYIYDYFDSNGNTYVNSFTIKRGTTGIFNFDFSGENSIVLIISMIILFIISGILLIYGLYLYSAVLLIILGFLLIFNVNILVGSIIILIGAILGFTQK